MSKLFVALTIVAFSASPMAFGAQEQAPFQLYKDAYIGLMKGKDAGIVANELLAKAKASGIGVKDVLDAAVAKGHLSQEQSNTIQELAQKNADLGSKVAAAKLSQADVVAFSKALAGRVNGAAYDCGEKYGCSQGSNNAQSAIAFIFIVLILCMISAAAGAA